MNNSMTVYESAESRGRDPAVTERFDRSLEALARVGIGVRIVLCETPDDVERSGEAWTTVHEQGMSALPVCEYQGVEVTVGQYTTDQDLADFLDVPDGVLSVDRTRPPAAANDIQPPCFIRPRDMTETIGF